MDLTQDRAYFAGIVTAAAKKVRKGEVRQVKTLGKGLKQLGQGIRIKQQEAEQYRKKDPGKVERLQKQVGILEHGSDHIQKAIHTLKGYKSVTVT
jgi:uncharacterized protein Yka (UPF0111/DUF47 family)